MSEPILSLPTYVAEAFVRCPSLADYGTPWRMSAHAPDVVRVLDCDVRVGPSCEVKASCVFRGSALAHLNYVGDSLIGAGVYLEAGAVLANHFNERRDKQIAVVFAARLVQTGVESSAPSWETSPCGPVSRANPWSALPLPPALGWDDSVLR